ncbi:MAG: PPC domain-containing protein [Deltaproteobacteria bacterium]|nr:PPC domain-containing protein [Deltaproteobacteria bacterium]
MIRFRTALVFPALFLIACLADAERAPGLDTEASALAQPVTASGTIVRGAWNHLGPYTAGVGAFTVTMTGTGDTDLYIRKGAQPTSTAYDCRPYKSGSSETCQLTLTAPTQVYVSVNGYAASSTYQLAINYTPPAACGNGVVETGETCDGGATTCTGLSSTYSGGSAACRADCGGWDTSTCTTTTTGTVVTDNQSGTVAQGAWKYYGPYAALSGDFKAVMTGTGDADLYVRKGAAPTTSAYDCRPYRSGSSESCLITLTAATPVYVAVRGYAASSTYQLAVTYTAAATAPVEWPNAQSSANSDPWIAQHHAQITVMKPRVLALNFVNAVSMDAMRTRLQGIIAALEEGSRYHGYANPQAPAFLDYQLAYTIDLRDVTPPAGYALHNSTRYPRENPVEGAWGFDYEQLFTQQFADYYHIPDPQNPSHNLTLAELVDRGLVNEVWVLGDADVPDVSAAEVLEIKPMYDANRVRLATMNRCAGNGCFDDEDAIPLTRSLRIGWVNATRGPGCFLESLGHGIESFGNSTNDVPYFSQYFQEFANMNMNTKYGTPFQNLYAVPYDGVHISYPTTTSLAYDIDGGGTVSNYDPVCGNVHFTPNGRAQYDLESPSPVQTSCMHFRDGTGLKDTFTTSMLDPYKGLAQDCMGPHMVWWRQNMPGLGNASKDAAGAPMLNWWPFLYY